jgi:hypothetical protein
MASLDERVKKLEDGLDEIKNQLKEITDRLEGTAAGGGQGGGGQRQTKGATSGAGTLPSPGAYIDPCQNICSLRVIDLMALLQMVCGRQPQPQSAASYCKQPKPCQPASAGPAKGIDLNDLANLVTSVWSAYLRPWRAMLCPPQPFTQALQVCAN